MFIWLPSWFRTLFEMGTGYKKIVRPRKHLPQHKTLLKNHASNVNSTPRQAKISIISDVFIFGPVGMQLKKVLINTLLIYLFGYNMNGMCQFTWGDVTSPQLSVLGRILNFCIFVSNDHLAESSSELWHSCKRKSDLYPWKVSAYIYFYDLYI